MTNPEKAWEIPLQEKIGKDGAHPKDFLWVLKKGPEVTLYLTIQGISDHIDSTSSGILNGASVEPNDLGRPFNDSLINLYLAVQQTARFRVSAPIVKDSLSDEYKRWWKWWHDYVEGLSERDWNELEHLSERKWDVSRWKPEVDWREDSTGQKTIIPSLSLPT